MAEPKYFVVYRGRKPGIYDNWTDVLTQVGGVKDPGFSLHQTKEQAENAVNFYLSQQAQCLRAQRSAMRLQVPLSGSILVGSLGYKQIRYGAALLNDPDRIFSDVLENCSENLGSFFAIVRALQYCKEHMSANAIYCADPTPIKWVQKRSVRTKYYDDHKHEIDIALSWLISNEFHNDILLWNKKWWGEIPLDLINYYWD